MPWCPLMALTPHDVPAHAGTLLAQPARCQVCLPGGWGAWPCIRGVSVLRQRCREIQCKVGALVQTPAEQRSFEQSFVWFLS